MQTSIGSSTLKPILLSHPSSSLAFSRSHLFSSCVTWNHRNSYQYSTFSLKSQYQAPLSYINAVSDLAKRKGSFVGNRLIHRSYVLSPARKQSRTIELVAHARRGLLAELQSIREENNLAGTLEFKTPLKIVRYPDPSLRAKNKRINVFDEKLEKLAEEMFDVMYRTDGVGLSAPQVGVNVQLMVFNPEGERGKGKEIVLVNPRIAKYANQRSVLTEGCLSFPQIEADVERPVSVRIEAQDIKGKKFAVHLKGFQARIFQHEYDHLQATLFFERMKPNVLETIIPALENLEKEYTKSTGLPAPEKISNKKQG